MKKKSGKFKNFSNFPSSLSMIGLNVAVGFFLLSYIGFRLDEKKGSDHYFLLGGIILGLIYCAYELWKLARQMNKQ